MQRPLLSHAYSNFNDTTLLQTKPSAELDDPLSVELSQEQCHEQWNTIGAYSNDVAYSGVTSDAGLLYADIKKKTMTVGETFRVMLTLFNCKDTYNIKKGRVVVMVTTGGVVRKKIEW